ncbi:MAG: hypothetical protein GIW94_05240 [Candidatus Eremiobacteraeota bacterium]|nr:hypothetical protein [Candidatus Eremiobacteraeota bacterium]
MVPLTIILVGALVFLLVKGLSYIASPDPPFGYYYDLGVNYAATKYMVHAVTSWRDFLDNLGWTSWGDVPNFYFNPELSYLALVPAARMFGHVWLWIKVVQIVQESIAFVGAASLYAILCRRTAWALVAGAVYAILPATALEVRGNLDIGWAITLLPLAISCSLALSRRFAESALPTCGVIISLCAFCFAAEYLFFVSIPAYAFIVAVVLKRGRYGRGVFYAVLGALCIFGIGCFFILPTLADGNLFSDAVGRADVLTNGTQITLLSESWYALLALLPTEFLISDISQFNSSSGVPGLLPATACLWTLALLAISVALKKAPSRAAVVALCIGTCLIVLSLGSTLPSGGALWMALRSIPGFLAVRSPDRFLALPFLLIVLAGVAALERIASVRLFQALSFGLLTGIIALFLQFDLGQHWLTNEGNQPAAEPDLNEVNAQVAAAGGRTVSLALTRGGSEFYTTTYGVPTPTLWYLWDIAGHYRSDGLTGYGLFRRAQVHTVVATPKWWTGSEELPDSSDIDESFPGKALTFSASGVLLKRISNDRSLNSRMPTCVNGGPGLLDWAAAIPELTSMTFLSPASPCSLNAYFDYSPPLMSSWHVIAHWDGSELAPEMRILQDADYSFAIGRLFINDAWYRNSIDGDTASSGLGARDVNAPASFPLVLPNAPIRSDQMLEVRLASHVPVRITITAAGRSLSASSSARAGIRSYLLPLREFAGLHHIMLTLDSFRAPAAKTTATWSGVAIDSVSIVAPSTQAYEFHRPVAAVLFSIEHLEGGANSRGTSNGALVPIESIGVVRNPASDQWAAGGTGFGSTIYRWTGDKGDYVIAASARLLGAGSSMTIGASPTLKPCCSATVGSDPSQLSSNLFLPAHLVHGSLVTVRLRYPTQIGGASAGLITLRTVRKLTVVQVAVDDAGRESAVLNADDPLGLVQTASAAHEVDFASGFARGHRGSLLAYRFRPLTAAESVTLRVDSAGGGDATARLDCDGYKAVEPILPPTTYLSVGGKRLRHCRAQVSWKNGSVDILALHFDSLGARLPDVRSLLWLPRGIYTARIFGDGVRQRAPSLLLDGRVAGHEIRLGADGYHTVDLRQLSSRDRVLAFIGAAALAYHLGTVNAHHVSTFDWRVYLNRSSALEVSSFPDGNWRLDSAAGKPQLGTRCDLINTCFLNVTAGDYRLHHTLPQSFRLGVLLTFITVAIAIIALTAERRLFAVASPSDNVAS